MTSTQTSVTFVLENGKHRRWNSDHVRLAGSNPGFELCQTSPSKRQVKCSIYNFNLLADAFMESQAAMASMRQENEALKARIRALEATAAETEALVAELLPSGAWTCPTASPPAGEPEASPPKVRREDAPEFAQTVPRLFRVGKGALYNQEGWLFDEQGEECVGFWNGKDIESFEDEDTDDEN